MTGGTKNRIELPKKEVLMNCMGDKKCNRIAKKGNFDGLQRGQKMQQNYQKRKFQWIAWGTKNGIELPKKEFLMNCMGDKKCNRITKKGNFDGLPRG